MDDPTILPVHTRLQGVSNHWVLINQPACGDLPFAPMDAVGHYDQRGDRAHFSIGRFTLRVT